MNSITHNKGEPMNSRHKLATTLGALVLSATALTGCAKTRDQITAQGGFFGSHKAPYVVVKQSGGVITDVYKLPNAIIQSEQGSDGWLFVDQSGRAVHIGGDMKSLRFDSTSDPQWGCYSEYHMEFEKQPYQALHSDIPDICRSR